MTQQDEAGWMGPLPAAAGCDCHVCRPDETYDEVDRETIDTVLRHGWQVIAVSDHPGCCELGDHDHEPDETREPSPPFAYTIGLGHRCGHPEVLMSGLDPGFMHEVLNDVAERVVNGRHLAAGDVLEGVLGGVPVVLEQASDTALIETVTWSGWFHRRKPDALVLVWPTTDGIFPWQPGAPDGLDDVQPRRWRMPIEHSAGVAADPDWPFPVPADHRAFACIHVVEDGEPVLWVARESAEQGGEDWSIHCGADDHEDDTVCVVHLAHLVRSAPSLRQLTDLGLDEQADRADPDSPWRRATLS